MSGSRGFSSSKFPSSKFKFLNSLSKCEFPPSIPSVNANPLLSPPVRKGILYISSAVLLTLAFWGRNIYIFWECIVREYVLGLHHLIEI